MIGKTPSTAAKDIVERISNSLDTIGIMYRIFSRIKNKNSLDKKIRGKSKYIEGVGKIQDLIGIRVVLYFPDDIKIVHNVISTLYMENRKDASIDDFNHELFKPVRYNLIYKLQENECFLFTEKNMEYVDTTFELQIRTVLSEGWHEVEHDLRFKFQCDWVDNNAESRKLNGVYASLETSEWTMIQIFQEIAYKHYKNKFWEAMFRQNLRLRIQDFNMGNELIILFNSDNELAKSFFRIDREQLINKMFECDFSYPLHIKTLIFFANMFFIKSEKITRITPVELIEDFSNYKVVN